MPLVPTNTFTPTATFTPIPTNTPVNTPTRTPKPCNLATWNPDSIDVTIPDYTKMAPNQVFSKTWRIRNAGTCSWNSSYKLIFDHGNGMGVPDGYSQPLTSGVVNPGQEVDLIVNNLKAPTDKGTYTGYWRLRAPNGAAFGITPSGDTFLVKIVVVPTTSLTLPAVANESGSVSSNGIVTIGDLSVGDSSTDKGIEMFLSYNISGIPSNATITEVKLNMRNSTMNGNPFSLGVLNLYPHDFKTLDASDYVFSLPSGGNLADWGSAVILNIVEASPELRTAIQAKLGSLRIQFRLQFQVQTNSNGIIDKLMYGLIAISDPINTPALSITYTTP
jgi:hypothetical protein